MRLKKKITTLPLDFLLSSSFNRRSLASKMDPFGWMETLNPSAKKESKRVFELPLHKFAFLFSLAVVLFFALFVRSFHLMVFSGHFNLARSEENRVVGEIAWPERGVIFDRHGEVLASNVPGFKVAVDPAVCHKSCDLDRLSGLLSISKEELFRILEEGQRSGVRNVTLKVNASRDLVVVLESNKDAFPGVFIEIAPVRYYPYPFAFSHVLGFAGEVSRQELENIADQGYIAGDFVGKSGVEKFYEVILRGRRGERLTEKNALGTMVREIATIKPVSGTDLYLTIDSDLQQFVYNALKQAVEKAGVKYGSAVVQRVDTGEVLSLVSYPSFDLNAPEKYLNDPKKPLFNRAVSGGFPPGSTFKLVTGSAALEEGVVDETTRIFDGGSISIGPYVYRGWKPSGLGSLTFVDALAWSSDIYFYTVAGGYEGQAGVGAQKLSEWAKKFGLGEKTGIDLPTDGAGLIPDPAWKWEVKGERWFTGNTYHMGIGQGDVLVTPLQLNNMMVSIANGGTLLKPFLVKRIGDGEPAKPVSISKDFVSDKTLDLLKQGMRKSVVSGPTFTARGSFVEIAGKTGTAETGRGTAHAWFTAFAPYSNPEIAVTVLIEEAGEGTYHATPVVREIMEHWFGR